MAPYDEAKICWDGKNEWENESEWEPGGRVGEKIKACEREWIRERKKFIRELMRKGERMPEKERRQKIDESSKH